MNKIVAETKNPLRRNSMLSFLFWTVVISVYIAAMYFHGSVMTNDEYTHWIGAVYLGVCQPTGMDILEFPGIASGKVPHLIWGNIGRVAGYHPMMFRTINVFVSLSFAFLYWILIRQHIRHPYIVMGFLLTYVYFFLPAHSILTDNIGLFFLVVFFAFILNEKSISVRKGILGLIALSLALYTRVWYIILPFAFLFVALSSYAVRQRPNPAKILVCLLGLVSILALVFYWGGFVQPLYQDDRGHRLAVTLWLPVYVISNVGIYLWPLVFLMPVKRAVWVGAGLLAPLFLGLIRAGIDIEYKIIGGLATNTFYFIGEALFGSGGANWVFLPFWFIGLVLLMQLLLLFYQEIRKIPAWSESPALILATACLGFIGVNLLTPMWSERYLAPFFICFFPFIPILVKRWEKTVWVWILCLFIIAMGHLAIQSAGYKRGAVIRYESLESTLKDEIAVIKGDHYRYLAKDIRACLDRKR